MVALTHYSVPFDLAARLWIISTSLTMTLIPAFSALSSDEGLAQSGTLLAKSMTYLILLSTPMVCIIAAFGKEILGVWMGAAFATDGSLVLQVLLVGTLVDYPCIVSCSFLEGGGYPKVLALTKLLYLPIHVSLNFVFLRFFGLVGPALALLALRAVYSCVFTFVALRALRFRVVGFIRRLVIPYSASAGLLGLCLLATFLSLGYRLAVSFVLVLGYSAFAWRFSVDAADRRALADIPGSLLGRAARILRRGSSASASQRGDK
jgi:O-antigen/teichoic acid export membrane protein